MTVLVLTEPCTKTVPHSPHPILVMSQHTPTLIHTLSCPGWSPTSNTSQPTPAVPATTSETPL